ncbi:MAG: GTP 3',8-cyclase MoaA [Planctomycetota bacterium]|jgi:cyclic pyranopterin phosphate synthase
MFDRFKRRINYLRVSVTDRCNLRCVWCMPEEGVELVPHDQVLSFEEILSVVRAAVDAGVDKVRLTGGEPLIRRDIVKLVAMLSKIEGVKDLAMTTNGILLQALAAPLRDAGLMRINVSLDALDAGRYRELTRGGDVRQVLEGINAARKAGLAPIKINCVVEESSSEPDARAVAAFAREHGYEPRFIRRMDVYRAEFSVVEGGNGGDCRQCNRLRLSSNGMISPCLFSDLSFSVRELGPAEAIRRAVEAKPESGQTGRHSGLYAIGG